MRLTLTIDLVDHILVIKENRGRGSWVIHFHTVVVCHELRYGHSLEELSYGHSISYFDNLK